MDFRRFAILLLAFSAPLALRADAREYTCGTTLEAFGALFPHLPALQADAPKASAPELTALHATVVATGPFWASLQIMSPMFPNPETWTASTTSLVQRRWALPGGVSATSAPGALVVGTAGTNSVNELAAFLADLSVEARYEPTVLLLHGATAAFDEERGRLLLSHAAAGQARVTPREIHELTHALVDRGKGTTPNRYRWTLTSLDGKRVGTDRADESRYARKVRSDETLAFAVVAQTVADAIPATGAAEFAKDALESLPIDPLELLQEAADNGVAQIDSAHPSLAQGTERHPRNGTVASHRVGNVHWLAGTNTTKDFGTEAKEVARVTKETVTAGREFRAALADLAKHGDAEKFRTDPRVVRSLALLEAAHGTKAWLGANGLAPATLARWAKP